MEEREGRGREEGEGSLARARVEWREKGEVTLSVSLGDKEIPETWFLWDFCDLIYNKKNCDVSNTLNWNSSG